jgi:tripartite-type tricarboxylate transporter receptor subunit TctC
MIEAAIPDCDMGNWYGLLMPAATAPAVVNSINAKTTEPLRCPNTKALLAKAEVEAIESSPQEFAKFIGAETAKFAALIKHAGIKAE